MKERYTIAVAGASAGSGASFLCGLLAGRHAKSEKTTLAELGNPYFYGALGMERKFAMRGFQSYIKLLESGKSVRTLQNVQDSINWALLMPGEHAPEAAALFRFMNNVPGETVIFDCSGMDDELLWNVLPEADHVYAVIDPMPSKLLEAYARLERIKLNFPDAELVVNKMNSGVHKGELRRFLGSRSFREIPLVDPSLLYKAEYNCVLPSSFLDKDFGL